MFRRFVSFVLLLALAAALLVVVLPQLVGVQREHYTAQLVSFRGIAAVAAVVVAVVLLLVAILLRPIRGFLRGAAVLLVVFALVSAGIVFERGTGDTKFQAKATGDITVLSWNTEGSRPGAATIAALALATKADVVSLPETSKATADAVTAALTAAGKPMQEFNLTYDELDPSHSTSLLISTALGKYTQSTATKTTETLPTVIATPDDASKPIIVGVHSAAPVPALLSEWRSGLSYLAKLCSGDDMVMAGDFNSTLDHQAGLGDQSAALGNCRDAAQATGNAGVGTWPTRLPALLGTPIDHVMATADWRATGMRVIETQDEAGSDHRPIVAQLSPVASTTTP
ncbi:endonuclease/exonuclease/phosphatase family protein [Frondihabitans cladoniiphilus]|uniref:Endonuclease/exonuclease/phosphatase domain-containing protein n=1 Tax=Frondihabitans cladoniiphilus TaxID=715785 RepID=A0ABP8VRJ1_9MICO